MNICKWRWRWLTTAAASLAALSVAVPGASARAAVRHSGVTITVLFGYAEPKQVAAFTRATGIKVNWEDLSFPDMQTKIAAGATANTYYADVADVDWSKVGEYYATKWFLPLNKYFPLSQVRAQYPQASTFIHNGELVGMPADISFLVSTANTKDFSAVGIKSMPTTMSQYQADLKMLQAHGFPHPLDVPYAAVEGLSTTWYEATAAFGGQVLSSSYQPEFASPSSPGYKAFEWLVSAYKSGLVPKANIDYKEGQAFGNDQATNLTATTFADDSGDVATLYDVPSSSKVVGQVAYLPVPGVHGPAPLLGNPDGLGIPATAEHVSAAVTFLKWWENPANQAVFAGADGTANAISGYPLPSNKGGLSLLSASGKVAGASQLETLANKYSRATFPSGAPPWYAAFSQAVYTNLHSAASGQESVAQAIGSIVSEVSSLQ